MILNFLNLFIILGILVGIVWFVKNLKKKKNFGSMKSSQYITVIDDGITISMGQHLSIVKSGSDYFMLCYGQNGVAFQKIDNDIITKEKQWEGNLQDEKHHNTFKEFGEVLKNEN